MDRALQIGKFCVCIAATIALLTIAWSIREFGKEAIDRKAETHAIADVAKREAHQTAEVIRERVKHENLAPYASAAQGITDVANAIKDKINSQDVTTIIANLKDGTKNISDTAKAINDRVDVVSPDDVNDIVQTVASDARNTYELISEARKSTAESVKTQITLQTNAERLLKPMGMFMSDIQFKGHELMFGVGCAPAKQDCPKPKLTKTQKIIRFIDTTHNAPQEAYYVWRMLHP